MEILHRGSLSTHTRVAIADLLVLTAHEPHQIVSLYDSLSAQFFIKTENILYRLTFPVLYFSAITPKKPTVA